MLLALALGPDPLPLSPLAVEAGVGVTGGKVIEVRFGTYLSVMSPRTVRVAAAAAATAGEGASSTEGFVPWCTQIS